MNLEKWFAKPIWFDDLNLNLEPIKLKCLDLRDSGFENRILSNSGGWQSNDIKLEEYSEFIEIKNIIDSKLVEVSSDIGQNFNCVLDNCWVNINEKGNYNRKHIHPNSTLSGTIYISVDDHCGRIRFHDYSLTEHYPYTDISSPLFYKDVSYSPRNGLILIFPAWLHHEVEISNSDESRISISFNIRQQN